MTHRELPLCRTAPFAFFGRLETRDVCFSSFFVFNISRFRLPFFLTTWELVLWECDSNRLKTYSTTLDITGVAILPHHCDDLLFANERNPVVFRPEPAVLDPFTAQDGVVVVFIGVSSRRYQSRH